MTGNLRIGHRIAQASGHAYDDCHVLIWRYDERFGPDGRNCESWIVHVEGWKPRVVLARSGLVAALWRAPSGLVYIVDGSDVVRVCDESDPDAGPVWHEVRLTGALEGIWGVSDRCVFVWGRDESGTTMVLRWDGTGWTTLPSPGRVLALSGTGLDDVWAVGAEGLASRWNGHEWVKPGGKPIEGALWDVCAMAPGDVWACGPRAGLYRWVESAWEPVETGGWRPACVVSWDGSVWVGAREDGLLRVEDDRLVLVDPAIGAERFDGRSSLLVTSPGALYVARPWDPKSSRSGDDPTAPRFEVSTLRAFVGLERDHPPRWEVLPDEDREIDAGALPDADW